MRGSISPKAKRVTPVTRDKRGRPKATWTLCPNPHCARLSECQQPEVCAAKPQKAACAPMWTNQLDKAPNPKKAKSQKIKPIPGRTREAIEETLPAQVVDLLTVKQRLFVREYLLDLNATQAAIRAGYSRHTASEIGYENLRKPKIMSAIEEALRQFGGITQTRLIDELGRLAFSDIGNVVAWDNDVEHVNTAVLGGPKGEAAGVTKVITCRVTVLPSAKIDPAARAAVASISQGVGGELRIKMHDKSQPSTNWRACWGCIVTRSMLHQRPSRLSQYSSTTALLTGSSLGRLVTHLHPRQWVAMETRATEALYVGAPCCPPPSAPTDLVTSSEDKTARIWDAASAKETALARP